MVYIFGPLHGLKFIVDEGEPVHAGVRIQDDILRITYYNVDRGDGRGPHEEVLELEPEDIGRMFGRDDGTEVTIQYRVPDGGTEMVEDCWGLGLMDEAERGALVERLNRYAAEYLGAGGLTEVKRKLSAISSRTDASDVSHEAMGPDATAEEMSVQVLDDAAELVALGVDSERAKQAVREMRRDDAHGFGRKVRIFVIAFVVAVAAEGLLIFLADDLGVIDPASILATVIMASLLIVIMIAAAVFLITPVVYLVSCLGASKRLKKQRVLIGRDRMSFTGTDGSVFYTDTSTEPFCIRRIDRYEVDGWQVEVFGSFKKDRTWSDDDGDHYETTFVGSFGIWRTMGAEDEAALLACLDRLK